MGIEKKPLWLIPSDLVNRTEEIERAGLLYDNEKRRYKFRKWIEDGDDYWV